MVRRLTPLARSPSTVITFFCSSYVLLTEMFCRVNALNPVVSTTPSCLVCEIEDTQYSVGTPSSRVDCDGPRDSSQFYSCKPSDGIVVRRFRRAALLGIVLKVPVHPRPCSGHSGAKCKYH
ncbi:hypothetical protein BV20DRAFT_566346 [Pilatotrama ljubarskyi]|nr:hypothetical protein BV20DRAFT_566346 [Pilatotrama ljubarskyi]